MSRIPNNGPSNTITAEKSKQNAQQFAFSPKPLWIEEEFPSPPYSLAIKKKKNCRYFLK
jgi:hypothetical protein